MFGLIRQFVLIPALLGIGLLGILPETAKADRYTDAVYQQGSVVMLIEPTCETREAILDIFNTLSNSFDAAFAEYRTKGDLCDHNFKARVSNRFGTTVTVFISGHQETFFTFEAIRISDGKRVYAIASGKYQDMQ